MPIYMHYPNQADMEIPLLKALIKRGGAIWFSVKGDELEEELGDLFNLTEEQREYSSPENNAKGHRKWRNHIQYVRFKLVEKGEIDNSVRDRWAVTVAGYRRVGATPPEGAPNR